MGDINICFVANYHKTDFFVEVGRRLFLNNKRIKIFWITVNHDLELKLAQEFGVDNVVRLGLDTKGGDGYESININDIIYGDRMLRNFSGAKTYLNSIQKPIVDFLNRKNISLIFGELTWAHELLIFRIAQCEDLVKCKYFNPHTIRLPNGFFAFFKDEFQSVLFKRSNNFKNYPEITVKKPSYLIQNNKNLSKYFSFNGRFRRFINYLTRRNYDNNDPTMFRSVWQQFLIRIETEINREWWRFVNKHKVDEFKNKNFVSLFLHKQPEASIDVIGRYYEDQLLNIKNIWRSLPPSWLLLVKEHSNAIGDRGRSFYNEVEKLPDVFLIDADEDSYRLMRQSKIVISVSGTVCYEAALLNIPSLTFASMFFNKLESSSQISNAELRSGGLLNFHCGTSDSLDINDFKNWLSWHSYLGDIGDPVSSPKCLSDENLKNVSHAFLEFIRDAEGVN